MTRPRHFELTTFTLNTTTVCSGPWVLFFVQRARQVRETVEPTGLLNAGQSSVALLEWFQAGHPSPSVLAIGTMLLLPWSIQRSDRRIWLGIAVGLVLALVCAMGFSPRLRGPAGADVSWAPFALLQHLPFMGWYHWPSRMMCFWSIVVPVSAALACGWIGRDGRLRRGMAVLLGLSMLGLGVSQNMQHRRWPEGRQCRYR